MDAALRPVAHVTGGDGSALVAEGALDDEDQRVADVAMAGKLGTRLDAFIPCHLAGERGVMRTRWDHRTSLAAVIAERSEVAVGFIVL